MGMPVTRRRRGEAVPKVPRKKSAADVNQAPHGDVF
jgi:hypothetical protein